MADLGATANGHLDLDTETVPLSKFIKQTDEATAVSRPTNIDEFYSEREHHEAEDEQKYEYEKKAEQEARSAELTAAAAEHEADKATATSEQLEADASEAREREKAAWRALGSYLRRPADSKRLKWARWALIFVGDVAGIGGASLLLGENVIFAAITALAVAASAITLGAVGREVRYVIAVRARAKEHGELSEEERQFASFFAGPHEGEAIFKIVILACATGALLIGVGIFALRTSTQGALTGLVFGCFAVGLGLASAYNSFDTADDVAELFDNLKAKRVEAEERARAARQDPSIKERAEAKAEIKSVRAENKAAGLAAVAGVRRHNFAVLGNSPGVAGNGTGSGRAQRNGKNGHASKVRLEKKG